MKNSQYSRRGFMAKGMCGLVSGVGAASTLLNLKLIGEAAAQSCAATDYKAMICLFFPGGVDSYNVVAPVSGAGGNLRTLYEGERGILQLPSSSLLALEGTSDFGLHPALTFLRDAHNTGDAAFVQGVGTLIQRATGAGTLSVPLPRGLYSHYDQQQEWQSCFTDAASFSGWAGRMSEFMNDLKSSEKFSLGINIDGGEILLNGDRSGAVSVGDVFNLDNPSDSDSFAADSSTPRSQLAYNAWKTGINNALGLAEGTLPQKYYNLVDLAYSDHVRLALKEGKNYNDIFTNSALTTGFTSTLNPLALKLLKVVKIIRERMKTTGTSVFDGVSRQIFFVSVNTTGGWDHHDKTLTKMGASLPEVNDALGVFWNALNGPTELGGNLRNKVTLFSVSEFGRTLGPNASSGSDHAWSGTQFVLGGGVNGRGKGTFSNGLFGRHPLQDGSLLGISGGRGTYAPLVSVDEYFRELAVWFGLARNGAYMGSIFPNLARRLSEPVVGGAGQSVTDIRTTANGVLTQLSQLMVPECTV